MRKKQPEVLIRRPDPKRRAAKILKWVEDDGGFSLPCGCFVGASSRELRILYDLAGPSSIIDIAVYLDREHEACKE